MISRRTPKINFYKKLCPFCFIYGGDRESVHYLKFLYLSFRFSPSTFFSNSSLYFMLFSISTFSLYVFNLIHNHNDICKTWSYCKLSHCFQIMLTKHVFIFNISKKRNKIKQNKTKLHIHNSKTSISKRNQLVLRMDWESVYLIQNQK